jgi:hypothetical protein
VWRQTITGFFGTHLVVDGLVCVAKMTTPNRIVTFLMVIALFTGAGLVFRRRWPLWMAWSSIVLGIVGLWEVLFL